MSDKKFEEKIYKLSPKEIILNVTLPYNLINEVENKDLGYYIDGEQGKTSTSIFKDNFLNATKGLTADTLQITLDTAGSSRMLIDTPDSKVVIAARQN